MGEGSKVFAEKAPSNGETHFYHIQPRSNGNAPGCRITSHRLLDQSQAGVYRGKRQIPPILGLLGPIRVPYPMGLNCWFNPL